MKTNILLFGSSGFIGNEIINSVSNDKITSSSYLNLEDRNKLFELIELHRPNWIINVSGCINSNNIDTWVDNKLILEEMKVISHHIPNLVLSASMAVRCNIIDTCNIIQLSSVAGLYPMSDYYSYSVKQAAIQMAIRQCQKSILKDESIRDKVRIYGIGPNAIENSKMVEYQCDKLGIVPEDYNNKNPHKRIQNVSEVINFINYLINNNPEFLSGTTTNFSSGMV